MRATANVSYLHAPTESPDPVPDPPDIRYADATTFGRHVMVIGYATTRRSTIKPQDLMVRFGMSRATSFRYLQRLRDAGFLDDLNRPYRSGRALAPATHVEHC